MDKPVLIVEMPKLTDEAAAGVYDFLQAFMTAFDSHYFCQLQRYYKQLSNDNGEDLF